MEKAYKKKIKHKEITALAKQLDWSERQVERWLRLRRSQDMPSTLTKFCENRSVMLNKYFINNPLSFVVYFNLKNYLIYSWRCLYYTFIFIYGIIVLWDKPWLWDIKNCYYGYPNHSVSNDIWWYYMVSISFYWSLSISQFFDVKRKDFWQMFIHHKATILLMSFSWVSNLTRIGSLVLVVHDSADIFLEVCQQLINI